MSGSPLKKHRRLVLVSASREGLDAALAERLADTWQIVRQVRTRGGWPQDLPATLRELQIPRGVTSAVLASDQCHALLLHQELPPGLKPAEVRELLRWEVQSELKTRASDHDLDEHEGAWEIGHQSAGKHQTAVAAMPSPLMQECNQAFAGTGLELVSVVPSLACGWPVPGDRANMEVMSAVLQETPDCRALSMLQNGKLEFFAIYPAGQAELPRNLLADLRSFPVKKLYRLEGDRSSAASIPGLPEPEPLGADWQWHSILAGTGAAVAPGQAIPSIACQDPTPAIWHQPRLWWAVAATVALGTGLPVFFGWIKEMREMEYRIERTKAQVTQTQLQLQAYEADAREFEALEKERQSLEAKIKVGVTDAARPGMAACAQVNYVKSTLGALSRTFARRMRLTRFRTDYEGHVMIEGESVQDAPVQDALSQFYAELEDYPVLHARATTTKQGASPGRLHFTVDGGTTKPNELLQTGPTLADMAAAQHEAMPSGVAPPVQPVVTPSPAPAQPAPAPAPAPAAVPAAPQETPATPPPAAPVTRVAEVLPAAPATPIAIQP